ncbi:MAG: FtsW/RodA/SpoVE family cell cycle protein [Peptococcaceae bacterium]|nr:FtsW/RodA/SpoVE family cell cycle protein [Peptococcaceae bacterium]
MALGVLWLGWGILVLQGKAPWEVWQLGVFSGLVIIGMFVEYVTRFRGDGVLLSLVLMIMSMGLVFVMRIDADLGNKDLSMHIVWACVGIVAYYGVVFGLKDYRRLGNYRYLWGVLAVILLGVTLVFGMSQFGATRWFQVGALSVQPEEMVKVCALLFLAAYLNANKELLSIGNIQLGPLSLPGRRVIGPFLMLMVLVLGSLAAQRSLGTAMVFFFLFVLMMYLVTGRKLYLVSSLPLAGVCAVLAYFLFSHVRVRVDGWLDPWADVAGDGYQMAQSLFALAAGGIFGTGLGQGAGASQIPVAESDFIFAVIAEELGFIGAVALIALFIVLIVRCFVTSLRVVDRFGQILAAGVGILLGVESLVILAGVLKLFPLTGLVLPWVSLGGNSLVLHFLLLGLLANMSHMSARIGPGAVAKRGEVYEL